MGDLPLRPKSKGAHSPEDVLSSALRLRSGRLARGGVRRGSVSEVPSAIEEPHRSCVLCPYRRTRAPAPAPRRLYNPQVFIGMKRVAAVVLVFLSLASAPAHAQTGGDRYYSETGHTLDGRFAAFFDGHGAVEVLGYPITDAFIDPQSGWMIQYTENARLELAPQGGGGVGVRLGALGEALGGWDPPLTAEQIPPSADATCRYFPESGHSVCHAFLTFFDRMGGAPLFGFPISEFKLEGDRIVQYFQAFRLDWFPEDASGRTVHVASLGRMHFDRQGYDASLLRPALPQDMVLYRVLELRPRASVARPLAPAEGEQLVSVAVRDQNWNPVPRASVLLTVHLVGENRLLLMPPTDDRGISQIAVSYAGQPRGTTVELEFLVVHGDLQAETRDSFRIWW